MKESLSYILIILGGAIIAACQSTGGADVNLLEIASTLAGKSQEWITSDVGTNYLQSLFAKWKGGPDPTTLATGGGIAAGGVLLWIKQILDAKKNSRKRGDQWEEKARLKARIEELEKLAINKLNGKQS